MKKLVLLLIPLLILPLFVGAQNETNYTDSEEKESFMGILANKIASAFIERGKEEAKSEIEEKKQGILEKYGIEDKLALLIFVGIISVVLFIVLKIAGFATKWIILAILLIIFVTLVKMAFS